MDKDICTGLHAVPVTADYPNIQRLNAIMNEAFPENERPDSRDVSEYCEGDGYVLLAFEDDHVPVGFSLLYDLGDNVYYGVYLAIAKEFRNRHYGTRALKLVKEEFLKGKIQFACIEALLPEAENYQQRVDRARFYLRNGMSLLDGVIDAGEAGKYQFICTEPNVTFEQLMPKMEPILSFLAENP